MNNRLIPFPLHYVGFDQLFREIEEELSRPPTKPTGWPPYNIRKLSELNYVVEMALAGFSKEDIEITVDKNQLHIKGASKKQIDETTYLFKGISGRSFERTFTISDTTYVKSAELTNGILEVHLQNIVPPEKEIRRIELK